MMCSKTLTTATGTTRRVVCQAVSEPLVCLNFKGYVTAMTVHQKWFANIKKWRATALDWQTKQKFKFVSCLGEWSYNKNVGNRVHCESILMNLVKGCHDSAGIQDSRTLLGPNLFQVGLVGKIEPSLMQWLYNIKGTVILLNKDISHNEFRTVIYRSNYSIWTIAI